jgi:hypothetical protein
MKINFSLKYQASLCACPFAAVLLHSALLSFSFVESLPSCAANQSVLRRPGWPFEAP